MLAQQSYRCSDGARAALRDCVGGRMRQPRFANARSIRNALKRARMRQAARPFESRGRPDDPMTIEADEMRASRVFEAGPEASLADRERPS